MSEPTTVLFVCPHGAAKSVLAAAVFERRARARGLAVRALSAGLEPDPEIAPAVRAALAAEGVDLGAARPRALTDADLARAATVVTLGCELGARATAVRAHERWDEVPPVSAGLGAARAAIETRVAALVDRLAAG
jgi:protein-tyrosine-phosphatase